MKIVYVILITLLFSACGAEQSDEAKKGTVKESNDRTKHTEIYDNGQVKVDGWMQDGERVGMWVSYYENGVRWSENEYREGMKDGKSVSYYSNGIMRYLGHYIEDKEAGTWQFYDNTGKLVEKKDFNK